MYCFRHQSDKNDLSYTCLNLFADQPDLKNRSLVDKDNKIMMYIDANGNVTIQPLITNHIFVDREHNELIIFDSNKKISIFSQQPVTQNQTLVPKIIEDKASQIQEKITRFNQLKAKGVKYKNKPQTEEELELRRLYQLIKYHERELNLSVPLISLK